MSCDLIGIDLAGPTNRDDTALSAWRVHDGSAQCLEIDTGFDDRRLVDHVRSWSDAPVVGLDAPLSYEPGGGDRMADRALRAAVERFDPRPSIMTPTMTRMAYLTLRGLAVARLILTERPRARIVETHPGAHLVLSGADAKDVGALKRDADARRRLVDWLASKAMESIEGRVLDDHQVASIAAARAAWRWSTGESAWHMPADPPLHPFAVCA